MTHRLHIDFETRSTIDLRKTGVYPYAPHPTTSVLCAAYAIDDEPVQLWVPPVIRNFTLGDRLPDLDSPYRVPGPRVPAVIKSAVDEGWEIVAHNAQFERVMWRDNLARVWGWPVPKLEQWRCTMVMAMGMSLPASLDGLAEALKLDIGKDAEGYGLMLRMCKPRKPRKDEDPNGLYWFEDEERLQRLYKYCMRDVEVERLAETKIKQLRPDEQAFYVLDQRINDRGVCVDVPLAKAALGIVETATERLDEEMADITGGAVPAASNVKALTSWLLERSITTESLDKEALDELLARKDIDKTTRRVLEVRREAAKGAVAKIEALLRGMSEDGRARGLLQFYGAISTGRWAGRRFQPQNIVRPLIDDVDTAIDVVSFGDEELLKRVYDEPLAIVSYILRGLIVASPGKQIFAGDYSNIEGRLLAWLAGEDWKLGAFRRFDEGTGPDLYKLAVSDLFRKHVDEVTKDERQKIGKVLELASGYQGGHGAYYKFGIDKAIPILMPLIKRPGPEWDAAAARYDKRLAFGLDLDEWTVVRIVIDRWRAKNGNIVRLWYDMDECAMFALKHPGQIYDCGKLRFRFEGGCLWMRLPSGRALCYPYALLREVDTKWGKTREAVTYFGQNTYTRKWGRQTMYGGKWAENATQAVARDVLAYALPRLEGAGYETILTVHDEVVSERDLRTGSVPEFDALMTQSPAWLAGAPITAESWNGERYRK